MRLCEWTLGVRARVLRCGVFLALGAVPRDDIPYSRLLRGLELLSRGYSDGHSGVARGRAGEPDECGTVGDAGG